MTPGEKKTGAKRRPESGKIDRRPEAEAARFAFNHAQVTGAGGIVFAVKQVFHIQFQLGMFAKQLAVPATKASATV